MPFRSILPSSSQGVPSTPVFLNRFSYSTTPSLQATLRWIHLRSPPDDLCVVLPHLHSQYHLEDNGNHAFQIFHNNMHLVRVLGNVERLILDAKLSIVPSYL